MQGIYNYIPERKQISRVRNIAAVLYLGLMLLVMFFTVLNIISLVITVMQGIYYHIS